MPLTSDPDGCWLDGRFTRPREMLTGCVVASYGERLGVPAACCFNLPAKFCTRQYNEDMTQITGAKRDSYNHLLCNLIRYNRSRVSLVRFLPFARTR